MTRRYLRIAWSVLCGAVCLLLVALWAHSYRARDFAYVRAGQRLVHVQSVNGEIGAQSAIWTIDPGAWRVRSDHDEPRLSLWETTWNGEQSPPDVDLGLKFRWRKIEASNGNAYVATVPHWFLILLATGAGALPSMGIRVRFGLRTFLIGVTAVAVGLAILVWW